MNKNNKIDRQKLINILLLFSILVAIIGFVADLHNTNKYTGIDLRSKVVGTRVLFQGKDPYHFKWNEDESPLLLDSVDNLSLPVNRLTVPPSVLLFPYSFMYKLNYKMQRFIWTILQWIFLLMSILFLYLSTDSIINKKLIIILGLLFISGSCFWRLHIERGQIYILYTMLIAFAYFLMVKLNKNNLLWCGFIIGITIVLRPTIGVFILPAIIFQKWKMLAGVISGAVIFLFLSILTVGIEPWLDYLSSIDTHGKISTGLIQINEFERPKQNFAEGMELNKLANIPRADTSILGVFGLFTKGITKINKSLGEFFNNISVNKNLILKGSLILVLVIISVLFVLVKNKDIVINDQMIFLYGIELSYIIGFFSYYRHSYSDVVVLIPLSLFLFQEKSINKFIKPTLILLLFGFFLHIGYNWLKDYQIIMASWSILLFSIIVTIQITNEMKQNKLIKF